MRPMRNTLITTCVTAGALLLAGCATQPAPAATAPSSEATTPAASSEPSTAAPTPTATPTPAPTTAAPPTTGSAAERIPGSCDEVGTSEHRAATVDQLGAQPPVGDEAELPQGMELALDCSWFAGDVTGANFFVYRTDDAAASAFRAAREMNGLTCEGDDAAWTCDQTRESDYQGNPIEEVSAYRYADGVAVEAFWSNLDFRPIYDDLGATIWR